MTDLQPLVASEFAALTSALSALSPAAWTSPSLCEDWSVANVVAHLTMAARYPAEKFQAELAADGFDFQKMSDRIAERDGLLPPAELLADLGGETMAGFEMPGGGYAGSLSHVVIHGLDATIPLRLGRVGSDEAAVAVLDALVAPGDRSIFGVELDDRLLVATDLDWRHGEGPETTASAGELIAMLSGRRLPGSTQVAG